MITQKTLKCDGYDGSGCSATLTTKPPMKPTPSNLRLHARTRGWTHRPRKDFCVLCTAIREYQEQSTSFCTQRRAKQ